MPMVTDESRSTAGEDVPVSTAVVEAVGSATGTPVLELPPLHEAVDPEALSDLFTDRENGQVRFRYAGCIVTIHADRTIEVSREV